MHTIRRFAVPVIAMSLLAISAIPVSAQSAEPSSDPAMASAWVTGTLALAPSCTGPATTTTDNDVQRQRGFRCEGQIVTMSDRRLSGTTVSEWNQDVYPVAGDDAIVISSGMYDLTNDNGGWLCRNTSIARGASSMGSEAETSVCVGSGAYEGLSAMLVLDWATSPVQITGAIFTGELPPRP